MKVKKIAEKFPLDREIQMIKVVSRDIRTSEVKFIFAVLPVLFCFLNFFLKEIKLKKKKKKGKKK